MKDQFKMENYRRSKEKGFSLVEVMVGIGISGLLIISLYKGLLSSESYSQSLENYTELTRISLLAEKHLSCSQSKATFPAGCQNLLAGSADTLVTLFDHDGNPLIDKPSSKADFTQFQKHYLYARCSTCSNCSKGVRVEIQAAPKKTIDALGTVSLDQALLDKSWQNIYGPGGSYGIGCGF